jgi:hypothetical protein
VGGALFSFLHGGRARPSSLNLAAMPRPLRALGSAWRDRLERVFQAPLPVAAAPLGDDAHERRLELLSRYLDHVVTWRSSDPKPTSRRFVLRCISIFATG